jgi:hypothetical protein
MTQLGRISGPLLEANLLRQGIDLTFRNYSSSDDILTLDVNNNRISINTLGSNELNVDSTIKSVNYIASSDATIANITASSNIFSTTSGPINIYPVQSNPLVLIENLQTPDIDINDNVIRNHAVNGSLFLDPNGTGTVQILSNTTVNGDVSVTGNFAISGNLSKQGNIIVGDNILDTVTVNTDFTQDIIPGTTVTYDLGKSNKRWRRAYVHNNSNITSLTYNSITISDQLQIDGPSASITTLQSNDSVRLNPSTGITDIERIRIQGDTMTNLDATAFTLASTGIGYVRFVDNSAVVIPSGNNTTERPTSPEVGSTRWNTTDGYMECFDGTVWSVATGGGVTVTETGMNDLGNIWTLVLG